MSLKWIGVTLAVFALGAAPANKKGKGKPTEPLMRAAFANAAGDTLTGVREVGQVVVPYYVDGRAATDDFAQDNSGVEVFLFGSKNLGFRLEDSDRVLSIDFGNGQPHGASCTGACEPLPPGWDDGQGNYVIERAVRELNNNGVVECSSGDTGIVCLEEGESAYSRFVVNWDEDGWRFRVRLRMDDDFVQGADPIIITRVHPMYDPSGQNRPTWTFVPDGDARARVTSTKIKGKRTTRDHGVFEMPFALTVSCVNADCS